MKTIGDDSLFLQKLKLFRQKKVSCGIPEDSSASSNLWTYSEAKRTLNSQLKKMEKSNRGVGIAILAIQLEEDPTGMGGTIVAEHSVFKGFSVALFNYKTKAHRIDHILEKIRAKGDPIDTLKLKEMYDKFNTKYRQLVQSNLTKVKDTRNNSVYLQIMQKYVLVVSQGPGDERWDAAMANIFALWTLQQAQYYHDAQGVGIKILIVQPHPAQVISIFLMLGVEEKKNGLTNRLIQIGTGEGKSVTLAITCCVLALFGFDVSCTSYSKYLSSRDFKIINEGGDMRKLVENLILPNNEKKSNEVERVICSKILLIDEIDVFFNKNFYGSCYSPAATLRHDTITNLLTSFGIIKAHFAIEECKIIQ
ncbi:hypothetical protein RFI_25289 [Reticulomyxa filosa]|uniref:SecA DEAD-like N-terminal domain-containing protein n=1 Tax=Reticulomyxa filosa TaxID=46433 RepID=X6MDJ3_RETFI|nr:hypothetical protein RFI_25289 [Reticulomyxa filosa]|eukprot:ETO12088.1 hypothetical protein RFI_25289 [Reticulomyxa filosa]